MINLGGDQERRQRQGDGPQGEEGAHDRAAHRDCRVIPEVRHSIIFIHGSRCHFGSLKPVPTEIKQIWTQIRAEEQDGKCC